MKTIIAGITICTTVVATNAQFPTGIDTMTIATVGVAILALIVIVGMFSTLKGR